MFCTMSHKAVKALVGSFFIKKFALGLLYEQNVPRETSLVFLLIYCYFFNKLAL